MKPIQFVYRFFFNEREERFPIVIDPKSMTLIQKESFDFPKWVKLDFCQCKSCPLDAKDHQYCPMAKAIYSSVNAFKDDVSTEVVKVQVSTEQRAYYRSMDLQHGFSSMLGLLMPVSGCPHFSFFKAMARFHLPFSTLEETIYRVTSSYLLGQLFKKKSDPSFDLTPLTQHYERLQAVNSDFVERIRGAVSRDGSLNAVVILDTFAQLLPFSFQDGLEELSYLYDS